MRAAQPDLHFFNSLDRKLDRFEPVHAGEARVYSCGPTVYNYPHLGNMRAYVFTDTLGRTLTHFGYRLTHIINITDVGHLTSDADAGEDKMEKMAAAQAKSIWDIARHYTDAYFADVEALNIRQPAKWSIATDHIDDMIDFARQIADKHCYEIDTGLYFDTATVADYGSLARARTGEGEARIDPVSGKRNAADFAIWRKSPPGEQRQMEWDSPWGRGAPGWHLECSVMALKYLGERFDIHTGGIDHREIHHPNEIAQNQAHSCTTHSGANIWMHNNFLVDRREGAASGKMSKSKGEFLRVPLLAQKGYHPLAYRLLCLQAHYRSELEFSWEGLGAALIRLKRMLIAAEKLSQLVESAHDVREEAITHPKLAPMLEAFDAAMADDLNTPKALTLFEEALAIKKVPAEQKLSLLHVMDAVLGLKLFELDRSDLRLRPDGADIDEAEIDKLLDERDAAREAKDFARSDEIRDMLKTRGVEPMDGDRLRWEWRIPV